MFGVMQLSYFILSDYDYINPLLIGVLDRKEVNGPNVSPSSSGSSSISSRVLLNGHSSEVYLANFNVMLYLTFAVCIVGLTMYTITYFMNRAVQ